jgi:hypothetical protein
LRSKFAVRETNSGAVLNGLVIGSSATIVSAIVSRKISIGRLLPARPVFDDVMLPRDAPVNQVVTGDAAALR